MTEDDITRNFIDHIENSLNVALANAVNLQQSVHNAEGDSDLYRKLAFYLVPNLSHWINGSQAGSIKDLRDLLEKRPK